MKLITYLGEGKARKATDRGKPNLETFTVRDPYDQLDFDGESYEQEWKAYNAHIASLPVYTVQEPSGWKIGEDYEENAHFRFQKQFLDEFDTWTNLNVFKSAYEDIEDEYKRTVIIPIEQEREDWKKKLREEVPSFLLNDAATIVKWIDENYVLTRKEQT